MLESDKILLRAMEPGDINLLYEWENDEELWFVTGIHAPVSRFDLEQYVLNAEKDLFKAGQLRLMIVEKNSGETTGTIDLFNPDIANGRAETGIFIAKKYRNQGLAKESLTLFLNYVKQHLGLHQIYATVPVNNIVSKHLFDRLQFEQTGIKKDWIKHQGKWIDAFFMQKILD